MPKVALLSDIHANIEALEACMAHARKNGATEFAFLGDLVGYGPDPCAVLDRLSELADQGAPVLLGNHDEAAVEGPPAGMSEMGRQGIEWTQPRLAQRHRDFIRSLPLVHRMGDTLLVHASASEPGAWKYLNHEDDAAESLAATDATQTFVGHVHYQRLFYQGSDGRTRVFHPTPAADISLSDHRRWVATIGSVGQPRDHNTAAAYAIFDPRLRTLTFCRVPYDWRRTVFKICSLGLPPALAQRLSEGR